MQFMNTNHLLGRIMHKIITLLLFFAMLGLTRPAAAQDYIVGKGDVLTIKVYDNDELDTTVRVSGDGTITMPLLGQIAVGGMEVTSISNLIETRLDKDYLVGPQVNVFIKEYRSKKVTILGQVEKPGLAELQGPTSLLELISKVGGLTKDAGNQAIIKRKTDNRQSGEDVISIDLKKLIELGDTSLNVPVRDGDSIYIAKAGVFYITGEVKKPASYKYEENPTLIKAITLAGGFTEKAARSRVRITRKIDGHEVVLEKVQMDTPVLPDDVIVIPESFF